MAEKRPQKRPAPRQTAPLFAEQGKRTAYDQDSDMEYENTRRKNKGKKKKRSGADVLYTIAIVIFAIIFLVSGGLLAKRFLDDRQTEGKFAALSDLIDETAESSSGEESNADKFARLVERNSEFIGWISIEGTNLDFPVMYSPTRANFYLRHDFEGEYSNYGVPYLDEDCTITADGRSNNLIIYGHNMKTGTIFGCLTGYKEASYYAEHPLIEFDTLYGDATYEVFAAFAIDVVADTSFPYNTYIDMDETAFDEFVTQAKSRSDVDSGITPEYGDELLTLSTCEYSTSDGRYVVCARRVENAG